MTKRTFVLFFWLAQFAVSLLIGQRRAVACKIDVGTEAFSPYEIEEKAGTGAIVLIDDTICKNETVVRADESEWKEAISDLLSHRHSTYRFLTLVSQAAPQYEITRIPKVIRESVQLLPVSNGEVTLPDYYSFLHRLCPF
ncbi:hypothetical protein GCM10010967_06560 [Dyadobacter beijingensis]|uniref:Uncharacterized protein n=1 Tax=Dyadobacter beijingensis TaxID=365489 RepID=A0ABQ2HDN8_9BACT|nr:hypothetical protein [Dyadobacter beijingensis]GGM77602.1 hypothetical protein GCM10010967_06560 [Dyadobacter beijingensis]